LVPKFSISDKWSAQLLHKTGDGNQIIVENNSNKMKTGIKTR